VLSISTPQPTPQYGQVDRVVRAASGMSDPDRGRHHAADAQLLGVDGVTVIAHGRSNARAVFSAVRAARDAVQNGVLEVIRGVASEIPAKAARDGAPAAPSDDDEE
jgi:hypothetical protein